jgi:hypothetical protein
VSQYKLILWEDGKAWLTTPDDVSPEEVARITTDFTEWANGSTRLVIFPHCDLVEVIDLREEGR